jgi:hypothetical protein
MVSDESLVEKVCNLRSKNNQLRVLIERLRWDYLAKCDEVNDQAAIIQKVRDLCDEFDAEETDPWYWADATGPIRAALDYKPDKRQPDKQKTWPVAGSLDWGARSPWPEPLND